MNSISVQSDSELNGPHVCVPLPIADPGVFNHDATAAVLHLLFDNPDRSFTHREFHRITGKGLGNVNGAVEALESLGVVQVDREGRSNQVRIDSTKVLFPADPIVAIPQAEYHAPVRAIVEAIRERVGEEAGIVLFGSVAQGEADRASDIDLFVVVKNDRMTAQRAAHSIEDDLSSERFDGERYQPHIVVETRESAASHDRIREVLTEGLTLRETSVLEAVKSEVFSRGD